MIVNTLSNHFKHPQTHPNTFRWPKSRFSKIAQFGHFGLFCAIFGPKLTKMHVTVPEWCSNHLQTIRNAYNPVKCHLKFVQTTKIDQNSSFWPFFDRYRIFSVPKYPTSVCKYPDCSGSICKRSGTPENIPKPTSTAFVRPKLTKIAHFGPILTVIGYFQSVNIRHRYLTIRMVPEVFANDPEHPKTYPNPPQLHLYDQNWLK